MDAEISDSVVPPESRDGDDQSHEPQDNGSNPPLASESAAYPATGLQADVDLGSALTAAMASQRWLAAIWRVEHGRVYFFRQISGFPTSDFDNALQLLHDDLRKPGQTSQGKGTE